MKKDKDTKITDKYVIRIMRVTERKSTFEENHGMNYQMYGNREKIEEFIHEGEYEIKDRKVISILKALLEK